MTELIQAVIDFIAQHPTWAWAVVFLTAMTEAIAVLGFFLPGTAILIGIGSIVGLGHLALWPVLIFSILGAIVGDGISYWIGRRYKTRICAGWPFRQRPWLIDRGERLFERHGAKSVVIGRFVPALRAVIPMIAGIAGMNPTRFYIANVVSALLWGPIHIVPGALAGLSFRSLGTIVERVPGGPVALGVTLAVLLAAGAWAVKLSLKRAGQS